MQKMWQKGAYNTGGVKMWIEKEIDQADGTAVCPFCNSTEYRRLDLEADGDTVSCKCQCECGREFVEVFPLKYQEYEDGNA